MYVFHNKNSCGIFTGDCVIRAIATAEDVDWHDIYDDLCVVGRMMCAWGDSNVVWESYLLDIGYDVEYITSDSEYTIYDFAKDHKNGTYLVATGYHLVCVKDGIVYDTWFSLDEKVKYYFYRRS